MINADDAEDWRAELWRRGADIYGDLGHLRPYQIELSFLRFGSTYVYFVSRNDEEIDIFSYLSSISRRK